MAYAAAAFQSPVAFGGGWGSFGLAVMDLETGSRRDGAVAASFGLGDPDQYLGLDVAAVVSSLSSSEGGEGGFGEERSFSFKLHRNLSGPVAVAFGATSIGGRGGAIYDRNNQPGYHLVVTRAFSVGDYLLMLSGGGGHNVMNMRTEGVDVVASAALYFRYWFSVITEYNGFSTNFAVSVAPLPDRLPLTLTVGVIDLALQHNDSHKLGAIASFGYRF